MKIALIDLKESKQGCNNKDKAGGFGNAAHGEGMASRIYSFLKRSQVEVVTAGHTNRHGLSSSITGRAKAFASAVPWTCSAPRRSTDTNVMLKSC